MASKNRKVEGNRIKIGILPHDSVRSARTHGTGILNLDEDLSLSRGRYGYLFNLGIGL